MNKLVALRQRVQDIKNEANVVLEQVDTTKGFTPEALAKLEELRAAKTKAEADVAAYEAFIGADRSASAALAAIEEPKVVNGRKVYNRLSDQMVANDLKPVNSAPESMAPFASLSEQMRAVMNYEKTHVSDPRLTAIQESFIRAALGGNEAVPAEGGFLVIPEYAQQLIKRTYDVALLANRCFKMPMASARLIMHAVDEDSRKDGSRWGGILAYWLAEAGTYQPTKPKFREMQLVANKLIALAYATEEQLADGPAWESYVSEAVPQELAFQIDTAIYSGPGAGAPLGFMNSGPLISTAKQKDSSGNTQANGTVVTNNILAMHKSLFARSRPTAAWFINQEIEDQLYTMALQNPSGSVLYTNPMYTPPGMNGNNTPYGLLMGKPVIPVEQASALGTPGDIVLADLQQYLLAQRADVRADTSIHVAFLTGEQAFRFMTRLDGQPMWKKPLTPYKGSTGFTVSPFLAIVQR